MCRSRRPTEFIGHAVRQLYLLAGVVDVAVETGDEVLLRRPSGCGTRRFDPRPTSPGDTDPVTGTRPSEIAYELPPDRAYAETCAAIGSFQWNWRMLLATGEHRYAEEMERVVYNAIAGATALDGDTSSTRTRCTYAPATTTVEDAPSQRLPWYACACCPPNLARLIGITALLPRNDRRRVAAGPPVHGVHISTSARTHVEIATEYPWDGTVRLTVAVGDDRPWPLALRVPSWCTSLGEHRRTSPPASRAGRWIPTADSRLAGQTVELQLDMPPRLMAPAPSHRRRSRAVSPWPAGPFVYAIEQADLPAETTLEDVTLDLRSRRARCARGSRVRRYRYRWRLLGRPGTRRLLRSIAPSASTARWARRPLPRHRRAVFPVGQPPSRCHAGLDSGGCPVLIRAPHGRGMNPKPVGSVRPKIRNRSVHVSEGNIR